jgi:small subunit ribosomal protein S16
MLKIKLARFGKKKQPEYRIVINEARDKRDGSYVEAIGHYNPIRKELIIDVKTYKDWISKGAQATDTVAALFKRFESGNPFPPKKGKKLSKKAKAKVEAEKQANQAPEAKQVAAAKEEKPAE